MNRRHILRALVAFVPAFTAIADVNAGVVDLSCTWDKIATPEFLADPGAKVAHDFLTDRRMPINLSIDLDDESVTHPDPKDVQALLIPRMRLYSTSDEITVILDEPHWTGTLNRDTRITIRIDRYTLNATAALEMADRPNEKLSAYWVLSGKCSKKAI